MDHREVDPGFLARGKQFIVLGEPPPGGEPGQRAFHNLPPFEDVEAAGSDLLPIEHRVLGGPNPVLTCPGMLHDLHLPAERFFHPRDEAAFLVRAVGPDQLESREAALQWLQEMLAALVILDIGLVDQYVQDQPQRIDEQMPLVPFHFLPAVVATITPFDRFFTD